MDASTSRCIAISGFFDNQTRVSVACPANCSTCKSSTLCTSCTNATFLDANGLCSTSCGPRYYANTILFICQSCPYDCYTCDGYGSCTSCNDTIDNRMLDTDIRRCMPIEGFFQNITTATKRLLFVNNGANVMRVSLKCPEGCKSCSSLTVCTACFDNYFYGIIGSTALCYSECPLRFYTNTQYKICQPCPYDCFTCDKYSNCLSCDPDNDHRKLFSVTGRCLALPGYYDNGTSACLNCPTTCSMCKSSSICSLCIQGYYLSARSTCENICQRGSIQLITGNKVGACTKCPYDCSYCNVQGQCTSCSDSSNREMNQDTLRCVPKIGYYDNGFEKCSKCQIGCAKCNSLDICLQCSQSYFLYNQSCFQNCPQRSYFDTSTYVCQLCPYDCLTCDSNRNCLTCSDGDNRFYSNVKLRCLPKNGYFDNSSKTVAAKCPQGCASCSSSTLCTYCTDGYFLASDNLCYFDSCPSRYYKDSTTRTCQNCALDCYTCADGVLCKSCNTRSDFRVFSPSSGRCVPESGYYESFVSTALPCSQGCSTCFSPQKCSYCFSGFYLFSDGFCYKSCPLRYFSDVSKCQPCSYDCLTCSRQNTCDSCSPDKHFRQLDNVTLRCIPKVGYYDFNQTVCVQCPNTCISCLSAVYCTRCKSGYYMLNNTCSSNCPKRYFIENYTLTCQQCPFDCFYCDSINNCLGCSITHDFRMMISLENRCNSVLGYYDNFSQICKPCQSGCSTCLSYTFCTACFPGYFLNLQSSCQTSCPARMFS